MADYLYGSARVRALETALIGQDRMEALLTARDLASFSEQLQEFGVAWVTDPQSGAVLYEETLLARLSSAYEEVLSLSENASVLRLWLYPYDCNNVKVAIKCFARGLDAHSMMFEFGTVSADAVARMAETGDYSALPRELCDAANEASAEYAKTRNPQVIDLILDRACYRAMLRVAEESKVAFAVELVQKKIDLVNLLTCVRILRMKNGEMGKLLLGQALLEGGMLPLSQLRAWFEGGETYLWERLGYSTYPALAKAVSESDGSLTAVERSLDNAWMREIKGAKFVAYGPEVLIAFLLAYEYEVRNLRICIAGKRAELPAETIRERIRESYV